MTEKFKQAVKNVVADGVVTPEEETLILNLANEEGVSENDAKIYLAGEKKKIKEKKEKKSTWEEIKPTLKDIGETVATVSGIIFTVLGAITTVKDFKNNKK